MNEKSAIIVLGTYDTKGEEHLFLKKRIEQRGLPTISIHVGTKKPASGEVNLDLYMRLKEKGWFTGNQDRDEMIAIMLQAGRRVVKRLHDEGKICGIVSAGGGSGTHLCTGIMRVLPLGIPKVMLSTVASRDMTDIVATKDITMMHSVADILGINTVLGTMLDKAAAAVCAMARSDWTLGRSQQRIALSFFGFITQAAEQIKKILEEKGYEVVAFHANGTGGTAMEELGKEGFFDGILDLATHELADHLLDGYCGGIGPHRFTPIGDNPIPRLVVPGGLDCAVLEFTRDAIPEPYKDRKIFFYDFRSAIRLNSEETTILARKLASRLNSGEGDVQVLVPTKGFSVADRKGGPLYDPEMTRLFIHRFTQDLVPSIGVKTEDLHINDPEFAQVAARMMDKMLVRKSHKEKTEP